MVGSGLGRAQVFMAQPHYQDQFRGLLGATAWPGTLNVTVEGTTDRLHRAAPTRRT